MAIGGDLTPQASPRESLATPTPSAGARLGTNAPARRVPREVVSPPEHQGRGLYVNEVFTSIQGEGDSTGRPTTFLRLMGCHLRCGWCDTTYSFHEGAWRSWEQVLTRLAEEPVKRLCLTGGEPLLQRDAWPLVRHLLQDGWEISIETSGSIEASEASRIEAELGPEVRGRLCLSMDVKCPGSGEASSWNARNLEHLRASDQLKFIIQDETDHAFADAFVRRHAPLPCDVWYHPVGGAPGARLEAMAERILSSGLDVRLGLQLHKLIWGDARGV